MTTAFSVTALSAIPLIQPTDDLAAILIAALHHNDLPLVDHDVVVVTSKIVSKAEGRIAALDSVTPSDDAHHYAKLTGKPPELVELILQESSHVSRTAPHGALIVEHRLGFICANAGIDQSNLEDGEQRVLLLPLDPDDSAQKLKAALDAAFGVSCGVVISDSQGRPFRMGNIGVAIGVAGLPALLDLRGERDLYGRELKITIQAYADLVASTAQLASGEGAEGRPVVLVRGLPPPSQTGTAADLNRPAQQDLYR